MIKCKAKFCDRESRAKGFCKNHWLRHKLGKPIDAPVKSISPVKNCSIENCSRESRAFGYCGVHYKRYKKGVDLFSPVKGEIALCKVANCTRNSFAKKMCNAHYIRARKGKDLTTKLTMRGQNLHCKIPNCSGVYEANGYCKVHYAKYRRLDRWNAVIEILGGRCNKCNEVYPAAVYDVHHLDPTKKEFSVGNQITNVSWEKILTEISKCKLLCANCHRITHFVDSERS